MFAPISLLLFFVSFTGVALDFSSSYSLTEYQNQGALLGDSETESLSNQSFLLNGSTDLNRSLSVSVGTRITKNDYDDLILRDSLNQEKTLGFDQNEYSILGSVDYSKSSHSISLGGEKTIGESPFALSALNALYSKSFYNQSTILSFGGGYSRIDQPENYFVDFDFSLKERPQKIETASVFFAAEQVFSRHTKGKLKVSTTQRIQERPLHYGFEYSQYLALNSRVFSTFSVAYFEDFKTKDLLRDGRGFFRSYQARADFNVEVLYDYWLNFAYTLGLQRENNPNTETIRQVGSDTFELGLSVDFADFSLASNVFYQNTNTEAKSLGFSSSLELRL